MLFKFIVHTQALSSKSVPPMNRTVEHVKPGDIAWVTKNVMKMASDQLKEKGTKVLAHHEDHKIITNTGW